MTISANEMTMLDTIQPTVDKIKSVDYRKHLSTFAQYILILAVAIGKAIRWAIPYIITGLRFLADGLEYLIEGNISPPEPTIQTQQGEDPIPVRKPKAQGFA
tara:strand:- start:307 stop:612 length:306 start_codon:yes stop_codon:yes gene_type:complete